MPAAPAASCALCSGRSARVTTSTPESPGIPARNGFNGVCRALPGDRALLPPSSCEYGMSAPGRADMPPQNLTPASGRQDHTTSPYATTSLVRVPVIAHGPFDPPCNPIARKTLPRPPHPVPTSVTIAKRPSVWDGMAKVLEVIWGVRKQKYFCKQDWTGSISLIRFNKFAVARKSDGRGGARYPDGANGSTQGATRR